MHCVNSGKLHLPLGVWNPHGRQLPRPSPQKREGGPLSGQRPVHEPSLALRFGFAVVCAAHRASTLLLCLQSSKISPRGLDVQKHSTLVPALRVLDVLEPLFSCRGFFWPIAIRWTGTIRQLRDLGSVELGKSTCCAGGSRFLPILGPFLLILPSSGFRTYHKQTCRKVTRMDTCKAPQSRANSSLTMCNWTSSQQRLPTNGRARRRISMTC